jgi:hypothetical protein
MADFFTWTQRGSPVSSPEKKWSSSFRHVSQYLQFGLGNVDFSFVDEFYDEFQIGVTDILRHYYRRMFARVLEEELLEVRRARRQHHLQKKNGKINEGEKTRGLLGVWTQDPHHH